MHNRDFEMGVTKRRIERKHNVLRAQQHETRKTHTTRQEPIASYYVGDAMWSANIRAANQGTTNRSPIVVPSFLFSSLTYLCLFANEVKHEQGHAAHTANTTVGLLSVCLPAWSCTSYSLTCCIWRSVLVSHGWEPMLLENCDMFA